MWFKNILLLIIITGILLCHSFKEVNSIPLGGHPRNVNSIIPGRNGRYKRGVVLRPGYSGSVNVIQATFDMEVGLGEASFMSFHK